LIGRAAWLRKTRGQIDLLMTGVVMPEMNGRDQAKRIMSIFPGIKRLQQGYNCQQQYLLF
jgi:YesN/AraC family two-component response regulator